MSTILLFILVDLLMHLMQSVNIMLSLIFCASLTYDFVKTDVSILCGMLVKCRGEIQTTYRPNFVEGFVS